MDSKKIRKIGGKSYETEKKVFPGGTKQLSAKITTGNTTRSKTSLIQKGAPAGKVEVTKRTSKSGVTAGGRDYSTTKSQTVFNGKKLPQSHFTNVSDGSVNHRKDSMAGRGTTKSVVGSSGVPKPVAKGPTTVKKVEIPSFKGAKNSKASNQVPKFIGLRRSSGKKL